MSRRFGRYTVGARMYDVLSLEWPVYRVGRVVGIDLLRLQPGDRVLDVGCGTGLNFAVLQGAIGPSGTIVGIDQSEQMLTRAHARAQRHQWGNVSLIQADAGSFDLDARSDVTPYDAVIATFALSIIDDGAAAWRRAMAVTKTGGRLAVVDLSLPSGRWSVLAPLARFACFTGGADLHRQPWQWVDRDLGEVERHSLRGGHIRVAAGSVPNPMTDERVVTQ